MSKGSQVENPFYMLVDGQWRPTKAGCEKIGAIICRAYGVTQGQVKNLDSPEPVETITPANSLPAADTQKEETR